MEQEIPIFTKELEKLMPNDIQKMVWSHTMDLLAITTSNNSMEVFFSFYFKNLIIKYFNFYL
jgi:hypothetical protein